MKKITISTLIPILAILLYLGGRHFYFQPKLVNGAGAPDFSGVTAEGQPFALSDLRGKYVLLDFWGSWCGPCRKQNPELVALYNQYRDKGLEIVSVGIESSEQSWRNAIEKDGMAWPYHLLDLTESKRFFQGPIADLYGITSVPTTYLLRPDGKVIAVNPTAEDVKKIIL